MELFDPSAAGLMEALAAPVKLNLGCSDRHMKGFLNVDVSEPCDMVADLSQSWPWPDSSVSEIFAWDVFEHLPSKQLSLNEAFRILIPGGRLDLVVPTTDGRGAFQDPTHCSFWTPNDLFYWVETFGEWQRFHTNPYYKINARYALKQWEHREHANKVWKLHAVLEAVK